MVDGVAIDSAEAVVEHLERIAFPRLEQAAAAIDLTDEAGLAEASSPCVLGR